MQDSITTVNMSQTPVPFTVEHLFLALGLGEQFPPIGVKDSLENRYPKPNWEGVAPTYEEENTVQPFHPHPAINLACELEVYDNHFTSKAETTENPTGRKRKSISPDTKQTSTLETNQDDRKEKVKESKHWKKHRTKQRNAESKQRQQWCPEWFDGWSDGF